MMATRSPSEGSRKGSRKGILKGEGAAEEGPNNVGGHIPVLLRQVVENLNIHEKGIYVDATFGAGGYSRAILECPGARVIAIDRDPNAIACATSLRDEFGDRLIFIDGRFGDMAELVREAGYDRVDGVVFDIGVSSMQIDDGARGFSFQSDGPLDMRMSGEGMSASDLVNSLAESDLSFILKFYGEERRARAIARKIVTVRADKPITRTFELVDIICSVLGRPKPHKKHPATRSFQALRIAVNQELHELARGLSAAEELLALDGRLVVVDFHSLEDRIVKKFLRSRSGQMPNISRHLPENPEQFPPPSLQIVNRRPVTPEEDEIARNPRARSARLRAASRTEAPAWPLDMDDFGLPD